MLIPKDCMYVVTDKVKEINNSRIGMNSSTRGEWRIAEEFQFAADLYDRLYIHELNNSYSDLELAYSYNATPTPNPWCAHYDFEIRYRKVPLTEYCIFEARRWVSERGYTPDNQLVPCHGDWKLKGYDVWMKLQDAAQALKICGLRGSFLRECTQMDVWLQACSDNKYLCPFLKLIDGQYSPLISRRNMLICAWGLNLLGYTAPIRDIVNRPDAYADKIVESSLYAFWRDYHLCSRFDGDGTPHITSDHVAQFVHAVRDKFKDQC